jgi:predicted acyl esterase
MLNPGRALQEDQALMGQKNEFWNSYWEDKRAKLGRVTCPAYVLASYSSKLHIQGSFRGWREIASTEKWHGFPRSMTHRFANMVRLRVHNEQEWRDWPFYQEDLALFFDFFLKGIKNSWPSTPPVRLSLLRFNPKLEDVINRPYPTYPPPSMKLETYFLDNQTKTGSPTAIATESQASYLASDSTAEIHFDITFNKYTELAGYPKLRLWMECDIHDDMDVFVLVGRVDQNGKTLRHVNFPTTLKREKLPLINVIQLQGPTGQLRASHRDWDVEGPSYAEEIPVPTKIDETAVSKEKIWDGKKEIWHPHLKSEKLSKGEVVKLEFTTWPIGMIFEKGEKMRLRISGKDLCLREANECESILFELWPI